MFFVEKLQEWLGKLMMIKGQDLYRAKGILSIIGSDDKYVFQSVHMMMRLDSSSNLDMNHKPWQKDEKRINKFCFIGKNLNKEEMISELKECIFNGVVPEPGPKPTAELRFEEGQLVICKQDEWKNGVILETWYREDLWETGRYAPYQVLLQDGNLIWVPRDSDVFIKAVTKDFSTSEM